MVRYQFSQIEQVVHKYFMELRGQYTIFTFTGPLGVGKTSLIKELFRQCGVEETVTSPSFGYVNTYHNKRGDTFYHFDLYRIADETSFFAAGFGDYFNASDKKITICIEWPEIIMQFLTHSDLQQNIYHFNVAYDSLHVECRVLTCVTHEKKG